MIPKKKMIIFTVFCVFFSLWWFGGYNQSQSIDEYYYPHEDYANDMSKIYFDMGCFAQNRGDFASAINFYNEALRIKKDFDKAYEHLKLCQARIGPNKTSQSI